MENVRKFLTLTANAVTIRNSSADWETKYDLIFSNEISGAIRQTNITFDWYDPDMGYDDDVIAYVEALEKKARQLTLIWNSIS